MKRVILGLLIATAVVPALAGDKPAASSPKAPKAKVITMSVTENGFEPSKVTVKKDEPVSLVITRKTDKTCATEIVIKDQAINEKLPLNKAVTVTFTPKKTGDIAYSCAMGMYGGVLTVE